MSMTPEEAVIGACLLDSSVIREAVQHVMPSDFAHWKGVSYSPLILDPPNVRGARRRVPVIRL